MCGIRLGTEQQTVKFGGEFDSPQTSDTGKVCGKKWTHYMIFSNHAELVALGICVRLLKVLFVFFGFIHITTHIFYVSSKE